MVTFPAFLELRDKKDAVQIIMKDLRDAGLIGLKGGTSAANSKYLTAGSNLLMMKEGGNQTGRRQWERVKRSARAGRKAVPLAGAEVLVAAQEELRVAGGEAVRVGELLAVEGRLMVLEKPKSLPIQDYSPKKNGSATWRS